MAIRQSFQLALGCAPEPPRELLKMQILLCRSGVGSDSAFLTSSKEAAACGAVGHALSSKDLEQPHLPCFIDGQTEAHRAEEWCSYQAGAVNGNLNQCLIGELPSDSKLWTMHPLPCHPFCLGGRRGRGKPGPISSCPCFN